jgi:hypothetical protein
MNEITWKTIPNFTDYIISNTGIIFNVKKCFRVKLTIDKVRGYVVFGLMDKIGKRHTKLLHIEMGKMFLINPESKRCIDHIDCNTSNNDLSNLRWSTHSQNNQNKSMSKNNTTGVKGVTFDKKSGKFRAQIQIDGINIYLGLFTTLEEAKDVRIRAANKVFGEYTNACEKI